MTNIGQQTPNAIVIIINPIIMLPRKIDSKNFFIESLLAYFALKQRLE
jgi:hypothetical protein